MEKLFHKPGKILQRISKNTFWIILLNIVIAFSQLIILSFINKKLGKEILGVWSLVMAATTIGQISAFGFSNGLVRYLPEYFIKKEFEKAEKMVATINVANFLFSLPFIFLLYFPMMLYANHLLKGEQLIMFHSAIIWNLVALFINNLFSAYSFIFDALQKYYIRSIIQIAGWILFVIISFCLMPTMQLTGVAIANVFQAVLQLVVAIVIIRQMKVFKRKRLLGFDKQVFKLIFSVGTKYQSISVLVIFFDPVIKFFITKTIGLSGTANYELANKIVSQGRNLLVNSNQVIIPKVVAHTTSNTLDPYFEKIIDRNLYLSIIIGLATLILSPVAILFFSGHFDRVLFQSIIIINIGVVSNMITSIHYFTCMGIDKLNNLVILHFLYPLIAIICSFILLKIGVHSLTAIAIPSFSILVGSIYNSIVLSEIRGACKWIWSNAFIYFIAVSLIVLFIPTYSFIYSIGLFFTFTIVFVFLFRAKLMSLLKNTPA